MNTYQWWVEYLQQTGSRRVGKMWQCPAHDDSYPSMSLSPGRDNRVIIKCFAGCSYDQILEALRLPAISMFEPMINPPKIQLRQVNPKVRYPKITHRAGSGGREYGLPIDTRFHFYTDRIRLAREIYEGGKKIRWEIKEANGDWRYSRDGDFDLKKLPLYYQSEVDFARAVGEEIILCESESSVEALTEAGFHATTWAGSASVVPLDTLRTQLSGMDVLWVPDNDPAGLKCSDLLSKELAPHCKSWRVVIGKAGQDARDIIKEMGPGAFMK